MNKKIINFHPYYKDILVGGEKTTTLRLNNKKGYLLHETVTITVGWTEEHAESLFDVIIEDIYEKEIWQLNDKDFEGESPECKTQESG